ncbi:hypothetical protein [Pseudophaeobacter leonis]|uniref:hypothetical protein n=1 Tax=Pseudophaeobacter leonis TaxID=1144477 RepID=UPI00111C06CA|nr:hypothetical protein [Pseudophaeobacter leonis]
MSEFALDGPELKKMVKLARKAPLGFAFNPGKSAEEHFFAIHRKRPPAFLGRVAKSEGPGNKAAFGTCFVEEKVMQLSCEVVVPAMAKAVKRFLKASKVSLNVVIMDAAGNVLESDIEDLPDDPDLYETAEQARPDPEQQSAAQPDAADQPDAASLVLRIKAAQPRIATAPKPIAEKLTAALQKVVASIKAQNLGAADQALTQIEAVLDKLPARTQPEPKPAAAAAQEEAAASGAAGVSADIQQLARDAQSLPDALKAKVIKPIQQLGALVKNNQIDQAAQGVAKVRQVIDTLIRQVGAAPTPQSPEQAPVATQEQESDLAAGESKAEAAQDATAGTETPEATEAPDGAGDGSEFFTPEDLLPENPADIWLDAKGQVDASLTPLMGLLSKAEDPNLARIAKFGLSGVTKGNNTALMAALLGYNSAAEADRAKSAQKLSQEADAYAAFLSSDPIIALCENNPFGQTLAIRAPLLNALKTIKQRVSA